MNVFDLRVLCIVDARAENEDDEEQVLGSREQGRDNWVSKSKLGKCMTGRILDVPGSIKNRHIKRLITLGKISRC